MSAQLRGNPTIENVERWMNSTSGNDKKQISQIHTLLESRKLVCKLKLLYNDIFARIWHSLLGGPPIKVTVSAGVGAKWWLRYIAGSETSLAASPTGATYDHRRLSNLMTGSIMLSSHTLILLLKFVQWNLAILTRNSALKPCRVFSLKLYARDKSIITAIITPGTTSFFFWVTSKGHRHFIGDQPPVW